MEIGGRANAQGYNRNRYLNVLRARIIPVFGNRQIPNIERYDVETFLAAGSRMYCRNKLRGMRASLGRTLSWAVACGWIEKNPCAGVKLPRAGKKVIRSILSAEQINALVAQLKEPYSTLVLPPGRKRAWNCDGWMARLPSHSEHQTPQAWLVGSCSSGHSRPLYAANG